MSGSFPVSQPSFSSDVCQVQLRKYAASRVGQLGGWPGLFGSAKFKHQPLANQLYWMVNEQLQGLTTFISYQQEKVFTVTDFKNDSIQSEEF